MNSVSSNSISMNFSAYLIPSCVEPQHSKNLPEIPDFWQNPTVFEKSLNSYFLEVFFGKVSSFKLVAPTFDFGVVEDLAHHSAKKSLEAGILQVP